MNGPSRHPSSRALLPGALLAMLVTAGALVALAVVVDVNRDAPGRLWLGGGDSAVRLEARDDAAVIGSERRAAAPPRSLPLAGGPVALLPGAAPARPAPAVVLRTPAAAARRPIARLRGNARVRHRADRRTAAPRPAQPAPAATAAPAAPAAQPAAPASAAAPAPDSTVVKVRGRSRTQTNVKVPKQRVKAPKPAKPAKPAPAAAPPAPAATPGPPRPSAPATGPPLDRRPGKPEKDKDKGVGHDDGVLERVPPGHAKHGG